MDSAIYLKTFTKSSGSKFILFKASKYWISYFAISEMILDVNPSDGIFVSGDKAVFISTLDFIFAYNQFIYGP